MGVRLPGRESRLGEPAYADWSALLDDVADALAPWLDRPFALYGHSFGAQIAFRLAARWNGTPDHRPRLVAVSGCPPPHGPCTHAGLAQLESERFFATLAHWGGIPPEALALDAFKQLFEPTLRADMALSEAWHGMAHEPIGPPIVAFAGRSDPMATPAVMREWARYAAGGFTLDELSGDHFFLREHAEHLIQEITARLRATDAPRADEGRRARG